MTLREIFNEIVEDVSLWIVFLTFFFAFGGLVIFSLRGIIKDDFESIYFIIGTAITLSGFTMLGGVLEKKKTKTEKKSLVIV